MEPRLPSETDISMTVAPVAGRVALGLGTHSTGTVDSIQQQSLAMRWLLLPERRQSSQVFLRETKSNQVVRLLSHL
jgi:hypothetical protein